MTEHGGHGVRTGFRFPVERRHLLKDEGRLERFPPEPILRAAGVEAGETVVDIGAGTGFWTLPLSKLVGDGGRVIATDVEPVMLEELRTLVREKRLRNVEVMDTDELAVPLSDAVVDMALLAFVLHEPSAPEALLKEVVRVLRPEGRILVIDWQKWETESGPPVHHRISEEEARGMLDEAGFLVERIDMPSPDAYGWLGRRRESG